jgi:hypothetical protein
MTGITDVGANAAQSTNESDGTDDRSEWEPTDVGGMSFAKQHPTTAVMGTAQTLRYFPDWDNDEPDRGYFGLIIDNPSVYTDDDALADSAVFQAPEDQSGDDYKIVNLDDEQTKHLEGSGVDFAGTLFYGEQAESIQNDQIVLKVTGSSGMSVASTLDVKGGTGARSIGSREDEAVELHGGGFPEHNGGLVEYHPDGRDGERPRVARHTELRPDVEGRDVVVMIQRLAEIDPDYDGPAYWATVFADLEQDRQSELTESYAESGGTDQDPEDFVTEIDDRAFTQLEPTTDFEPDEDMVEATGYIQWRRAGLDELNEARAEAGLDPYNPEGSEATAAEEHAEA